MAATAALTERARQGESLDALVWRVLGRTSGAVEAVMEANPGIAAQAAALPEGRLVTIPVAAAAPPRAALIQLWD